jgi:hypothetical protein
MLFEFRPKQVISILLPRSAVGLLLILAIPHGTSWAQQDEVARSSIQHLGFRFAGRIASYREDLVVPLGFHGPCLSLGPVYTRQAEKDLTHIRIDFSAGYLKNRYSHEAYVVRMELHASWVRNLTEHDKFGDLWGGVSLPVQMNNLFLESWDDAHLYWLTTYSLAPAVEWHKKISQKDRAIVRMETPVISLVSRPPAYRHNKQDALTHWTYHFTGPNRALHLEGPGTYRGILLRILLMREMKYSLVSLGCEFQYHYCSEPQPIRAMNTSITLSYQWRIRS